MENNEVKTVVTVRYYASCKVGGSYIVTEKRTRWQDVYNDVFALHNKANRYFQVTFCTEKSVQSAKQ